MKTNYHTHSCWCDGKGKPREYVEYALSKGFHTIGFSGHAPVPFQSSFAIRDTDYLTYCDEVRGLGNEYRGRIDVKLGLEIDYIPGLQDDFGKFVVDGGLDYTIGAVHLVSDYGTLPSGPDDLWFIDGPLQERYDEGLLKIFGGDIRRAVSSYFRQYNAMLERNKPTIAAHFDKVIMHNRGRFFQPDDSWYRSLLLETVDLIRQLGVVCEINTRGIYKGRHFDFYPSSDIIRHMNTLGIPVVVSTDAHQPSDLDLDSGAYKFLHEIGYRNVVDTTVSLRYYRANSR